MNLCMMCSLTMLAFMALIRGNDYVQPHQQLQPQRVDQSPVAMGGIPQAGHSTFISQTF